MIIWSEWTIIGRFIGISETFQNLLTPLQLEVGQQKENHTESLG